MSTSSVETLTNPNLQKTPAARTPYLLYYRQGNNPHSQFLVFNHPSTDIHIVVERAKRHCEVMNYRFVNVRPLVIDLDMAERRQSGADSEGS